ncbi:MAG: 2-oxo-4-hydroxy-4-carboxy-5-ureidoimidazoline decarboxylase [Ahrensia sp.]|nr:2-oxo-4-hydroxy-4-carboxy-5-ureidoimidazoline decarboxylase [Ahrensia sp.]
MSLTLTELNASSDSKFVAYLEDVAEHSTWVVERAVEHRPFTSLRSLHHTICDVIAQASSREQRALIMAHPDLAGKAARAGDMTDASISEQAGAGLDQLTDEEFERFEELNGAYRSKFGFPFIIAVKGHDKTSILQAFVERLENDMKSEQREALAQICEIIRYRLETMISHEQ